MIFIAKVLDKNGKTQTIRRECETSFSFKKELHKKGYQIISINEKRKFSSFPFFKQFEKHVFLSELSTLLHSGVLLGNALHIIGKSTRYGTMLSEMSQGLSMGRPFWELIEKEKILSSAEVAILRSGEESGELKEVIRRLAEQAKKSQLLEQKVISSLFYPFVLVVVMSGVFSFIVFYIMPILKKVYEDVGIELGRTAAFLLNLVDFVLENNIVVGLFLLAFFSMVFLFVQNKKEVIIEKLIVVPIVGDLIKSYLKNVILPPFSLMLNKGVPFSKAVFSLSEAFEKWPMISRFFSTLGTVVKRGGKPSEVFLESSLFTVQEKELVSVGEETKRFVSMIEYIQKENEDHLENNLQRFVSLIEPIIIIFIGSMVMAFVVIFIVPILTLDLSGT